MDLGTSSVFIRTSLLGQMESCTFLYSAFSCSSQHLIYLWTVVVLHLAFCYSIISFCIGIFGLHYWVFLAVGLVLEAECADYS